MADAFARRDLPWIGGAIQIGALTGITSVLLVMMLSQPRILLAMARDGLLPRSIFGHVHPRFQTPWVATLITGFVVALAAGCLPIDFLAELVSIGTLLAFVLVSTAVLIMRQTNPDTRRPFKVPFYPVTPILGIAFCVTLMFSLPSHNWIRLVGWLTLGMLIYFGYGVWHSRYGQEIRNTSS